MFMVYTSLSLGPAFVFIKGIPLKAFLVAASTIPLKECLCIFSSIWNFDKKVWLDWKYYNVSPMHIFPSLIRVKDCFQIWMYIKSTVAFGVYIMYKYQSLYDQWQDTSVWSKCEDFVNITYSSWFWEYHIHTLPKKVNYQTLMLWKSCQALNNSFSESSKPSAEWIILNLKN